MSEAHDGGPRGADVREEMDYLASIGCHRDSLDAVADILEHREIGYRGASALEAFIHGTAARLKDLKAPKGGCLLPDPPPERAIDVMTYLEVYGLNPPLYTQGWTTATAYSSAHVTSINRVIDEGSKNARELAGCFPPSHRVRVRIIGVEARDGGVHYEEMVNGTAP